MLNNMGFIMEQVQRLQQELKNMSVQVNEGEGAVRVVMNGHQEVLEVKFAPAVLRPENLEVLQTMVADAFNKAVKESKQMLKNEVGKITGGMGLPNITGLF